MCAAEEIARRSDNAMRVDYRPREGLLVANAKVLSACPCVPTPAEPHPSNDIEDPQIRHLGAETRRPQLSQSDVPVVVRQAGAERHPVFALGCVDNGADDGVEDGNEPRPLAGEQLAGDHRSHTVIGREAIPGRKGRRQFLVRGIPKVDAVWNCTDGSPDGWLVLVQHASNHESGHSYVEECHGEEIVRPDVIGLVVTEGVEGRPGEGAAGIEVCLDQRRGVEIKGHVDSLADGLGGGRVTTARGHGPPFGVHWLSMAAEERMPTPLPDELCAVVCRAGFIRPDRTVAPIRRA